MQLPAEYRAAQRALIKAARTVAEAKDIRGKAMSMEVYAYQAKDAELVAASVEVKEWSTRRIGELMDIARKAGKLAKAPGGSKARPRKDRGDESPDHQTLDQQGVDKDLAKEARKAWALDLDKFVARLAKKQKIAVAAVEGLSQVIAAARAERHAIKAAKRAAREQALARKLLALPKKKYAVIVADPEWRWSAWSDKGIDSTSADNHYQTSPLEEIKARDVASIAADDCVLFLWATVPMTPHALEVMAAWGFNYVSQ